MLGVNEGILTTRDFHIGDKLKFLDAFVNEKEALEPYAWKVKFQCDDGFIGKAADDNFLCEDDWFELESYFKAKINSDSNYA